MNTLQKKITAAVCIPLCIHALTTSLFGSEGDINNPTSNSREIIAVPSPGAVHIDGLTDDWDLSAGILSYNDPTLVDKYSVWSHVMYDDKGVYLVMRYRDDSPMKNGTSGEDFHNSWQADAFQGRAIFDYETDDVHQMHVNGFYSSEENRPYMIVQHGGFKKKPPYDSTGPARDDQKAHYGSTMDNFDGKIAFKEWDDGKGYNLEAFWPWTYARTSGKPLRAGDKFVLGLEAMWGNADGSKLEHRLVDNLRNDAVNRIFFFRALKGWGEVKLSAKGNLNITEQQQELQVARLKKFLNVDTAGSMEIAYTLPSDRDVTIAIDNADGLRVRNLIGQFPRPAGENVDYWDGLDDSGNPVPEGTYTAAIVDHEPITLKFLNSVYNSSTPPWTTEKGFLSWGSNHGHPTSVATRGDISIFGFTGTEGTAGVLRKDTDGRVLWIDVTESLDVTMDDKFVYLFSRESWTKRAMVRKLDINTGDITLFTDEARSTESVLPIDYQKATENSTIAYAYGKLFVFIPGEGLWRMNPSDGKIEEHFEIDDLLALDNHEDTLWAMFADGRIAQLNESGQVEKKTGIQADSLHEPVRFAISQDGERFAVSDQGTNQAFIFNKQSKRIHTIGQPYQDHDALRPAGKFIATDLVAPLGLDFDSNGQLWITEASHSCRRVTSWTPQGKLNDQFWGSADYGAMFGFAFVDDSTRFMVHGIEFKLDPNPDIMNRPTQEQALYFHPELSHGERGLIYQLNGHEYATTPMDSKSDGFEIAMRGEDNIFRKVVIVNYDNLRTKDVDESMAWIDKNENGREDTDEVVMPITGRNSYWSAGWVRPDLTVITADQQIYRPTGFTESGVPLYDFTKAERPKQIVTGFYGGDNTSPNPNGAIGTFVMDMAGNISDGINYATVDGRVGAYPNPYKRHDAPAAQRGMLIAPFRTNGLVEDVPGVGSVTALGGDRGQWFLLSLDGLYISAILQDAKGEITLNDQFVGQESFGGFFWRDEQDRVLVQLGGSSFRIMQVHGLETTRKQIIPIKASQDDIVAGMKIAMANRKEAYQEPEKLTISKVNQLINTAPTSNLSIEQTLIPGAETARIQEEGDPSRWFRVAMAHDDKKLAIVFQVNDRTPWVNGEGRFSHAFIGGDCVDLQLEVPGRGTIRILGAPLVSGNTVAYWQTKADTPDNPTTYVVSNNQANAETFDIVKRLKSARINVKTGDSKYTAYISVPLEEIGLNPSELSEVKGIAGVIFSDPAGTNRASRLYWHDKSTGMVSDVPTESRLNTRNWGTIQIGK